MAVMITRNRFIGWYVLASSRRPLRPHHSPSQGASVFQVKRSWCSIDTRSFDDTEQPRARHCAERSERASLEEEEEAISVKANTDTFAQGICRLQHPDLAGRERGAEEELGDPGLLQRRHVLYVPSPPR